MPILVVKELSKKFSLPTKHPWKKGTITALNQVSFSVEAGQTLGIVGESGCGKSTLAKVIMRLQSADSGTVEFDGCDVLRADKKQLCQIREQMQIVFQDPYASLSPHMTVQRLIAEPLKIAGRPHGKQEILSLMQQVGLQPEDLNRFPSEFSGGQRQRICIARAIALKPRLLICDEPVSALDVSVQSQILNLFNNLQKDLELTYVFISHDLSVVRHVSNQICVMYLGCVVERGPTELVYKNPHHPYTQCLLNAVLQPEPDNAGLSHIGTQLEFHEVSPDHKGCPFYHRCLNAMPICRDQKPKETEITPGHFFSCHSTKNK